MVKLFAVTLGGRADGCNSELHDVVFVAAETIQKAYPALVNKWFGSKKRLHMDAYIELNHADGYDISLSKEKSHDENKLFFVNFGMYKENYFGEIHESGFYVGKSKPEILARTKEILCVQGIEPHCDDNIIIDDCIGINQVGEFHLHFTKADFKQLTIVPGYQRLDSSAILEQALALESGL